MPDYCLHTSKRQEQYSIAWILSLAAASGYSLEEIRVDVDSVDATLKQKPDGLEAPDIDRLDVQLKCTYAHNPNENTFPFPLEIKNYDDLRRTKLTVPRILVVLHVPPEPGAWIEFDPHGLTLRNCAYWACLRALPATTNKTKVVVHIPVAQRLNVETLTQLMMGLSVNNLPISLGPDEIVEEEAVGELIEIDEAVAEIAGNGVKVNEEGG